MNPDPDHETEFWKIQIMKQNFGRRKELKYLNFKTNYWLFLFSLNMIWSQLCSLITLVDYVSESLIRFGIQIKCHEKKNINETLSFKGHPMPLSSLGVIVVYQCTITTNGFTGGIEALLYFKVHAVLECKKHSRCFMEPILLRFP